MGNIQTSPEQREDRMQEFHNDRIKEAYLNKMLDTMKKSTIVSFNPATGEIVYDDHSAKWFKFWQDHYVEYVKSAYPDLFVQP